MGYTYESDTDEYWIDIPGHPRYQCDIYGRIRHKFNKNILRGYINKDGYRAVSLENDKICLVHRLICETFYGPPLPGQTQVNHINCDRLDNRLLNLQWCSPRENMDWVSIKGHLRYEEGLKRAREVNIKPVRIVETGQVFASVRDCADYLGVPRGNVSRVLCGYRKGQKLHGFTIEYVREEDL